MNIDLNTPNLIAAKLAGADEPIYSDWGKCALCQTSTYEPQVGPGEYAHRDECPWKLAMEFQRYMENPPLSPATSPLISEETLEAAKRGDQAARAEITAGLGQFFKRQTEKLDAWIAEAEQWLRDNPEQTCSLCKAPLNRDGSCSRSCAGVGGRMNYAFSERNWICRYFGHRFSRMYLADNAVRQTCSLCGKTRPPFRKLSQEPPYDYLPDSEQPPGAC